MSTLNGIRRLLAWRPMDRRVRALWKASRKELMSGGPAEGTVAVQCVEDPLYFGLFASICSELRRVGRHRIELVVVRSINGAVGTGILHAVARSAMVGRIISAQWIRTYRKFADGVAYYSQSLAHPFADLRNWSRATRLWRSLGSASELVVLELDGVLVGDLIADSYLRFRPSPWVDVNDRFVQRLIWQALRDIRVARKYFNRRKPALYLTSYSTYIEHGIAVRIALQEQVRVLSFGSLSRFGKYLSLEDDMHTPDARGYKMEFLKLDRQQERLDEAERVLGERLSGGKDLATFYMKVSAYGKSSEVCPPLDGAVVVFLHDFYDSPHVYHELVFPDFWSWICATIDVLIEVGIPFAVKPHPNQVHLSGEAVSRLQRKYPGLLLLSPRLTNTQLAQAGMVCGVTVYGTVAHELAYLGIPTIGCARHPHCAFTFCRTARTPEQYRELLLSAPSLTIDKAALRREALQFFYMHNLHGDKEALRLRRTFAELWRVCNDPDPDSEKIVDMFAQLRGEPGFRDFICETVRAGSVHG